MLFDFFLFAVEFLIHMIIGVCLLYLLLQLAETVADRVEAWWWVKSVEWSRRHGRWC